MEHQQTIHGSFCGKKIEYKIYKLFSFTQSNTSLNAWQRNKALPYNDFRYICFFLFSVGVFLPTDRTKQTTKDLQTETQVIDKSIENGF